MFIAFRRYYFWVNYVNAWGELEDFLIQRLIDKSIEATGRIWICHRIKIILLSGSELRREL